MELASKITLRQLELFCAAADHGSFAAAAQALYLTPNAVALAVRDLETALNAHLCIRQRSRGLTLTPSGTYLVELARRLLREADELCRGVGSFGGPLRGPVSVGCYSTLAATVLPPLMEGFRDAHPGLELRIVDGTVNDLLPMLQGGEIDVMIGYHFGMPGDLDHVVLFDTEVHVLLPADHRLAGEESISLTDVLEDPLILLDLPPSGDHTLHMFSRAGVRPKIAHRTSNFELVRSLVARGFGYSVLIQKPANDESYEGRRVVAKRIVPQFSAESVVIAWPSPVRLSDRAQALVDYARLTVAEHQWTPARASGKANE
ncbi:MULTISPECIES: LysR family transcriptional regulator [Arthrobacter]|uniref:LysR family transcriptional regulator n=1 Tax=Arthrobacter terricola TaxID=2547396 RepID=A0A4R5KJ34_9MICC|nr:MULTISPECIES: LysR family transcriptional regulator [Arthrobacter]MBT8161935.1 LysR family transcriptional regulator [Arthrobacter sp. GN70]TDF94310.1 LysR family transcriptional regulator [Arthrobacter terricola]